MEWISIKDQEPPKTEPFLGYVLVGFSYNFRKIDHRVREIHTCVWEGEKFVEYCNCSGYEIDQERIEVIYWMPLPDAPKET